MDSKQRKSPANRTLYLLANEVETKHIMNFLALFKGRGETT